MITIGNAASTWHAMLLPVVTEFFFPETHLFPALLRLGQPTMMMMDLTTFQHSREFCLICLVMFCSNLLFTLKNNNMCMHCYVAVFILSWFLTIMMSDRNMRRLEKWSPGL